MTPAEVIHGLGGVRQVAEGLGIGNPNTVRYWLRPGRGIPLHRFPAILALPQAQQVGLTFADLHDVPRVSAAQDAA